MTWEDIDLDALRRLRSVSYHFRYPLTSRDFHVVCVDDNARGHCASKALQRHARHQDQQRRDITLFIGLSPSLIR